MRQAAMVLLNLGSGCGTVLRVRLLVDVGSDGLVNFYEKWKILLVDFGGDNVCIVYRVGDS